MEVGEIFSLKSNFFKINLPSTNIPGLDDNLIPYGILPPLLILSIERKQLHDESVNLRKSQHLTLRVLDRHRDQRDQAGRREAMVRWEFWGWMELVDWRTSLDLFPFYRQINSSSWEGGLYSTNRKCFLLSATSLWTWEGASPMNFVAYSCRPKFWGGWDRPPKKWSGADWCVPYAIVPPGLVLSVVRKEVHYKFVDFGQGQHLARRTVDRHVYHGYVAKE